MDLIKPKLFFYQMVPCYFSPASSFLLAVLLIFTRKNLSKGTSEKNPALLGRTKIQRQNYHLANREHNHIYQILKVTATSPPENGWLEDVMEGLIIFRGKLCVLGGVLIFRG